MSITSPDFSSTGIYGGPNFSEFGVMTAPPSSLESAAFNFALPIARREIGAGGAGFDALQKLLTTGSLPFDMQSNPFLPDVISSSWNALQPELEQAQSKLKSEATLAGQGGAISSPLLNQEETLYQGTFDKLIADATGLAAQNYNTQQGLEASALGLATGMPSTGLNTLTQTGGLEQSLGQNALTAMYQDFLRQSGLDQNTINQIMQYVTGNIGLSGSAPVQYGQSPFSQILGGLTSVLPFFTFNGGGSNIMPISNVPGGENFFTIPQPDTGPFTNIP